MPAATFDIKNSVSSRRRRRVKNTMNTRIRNSVGASFALLLASCASNFEPPPLTANNPASVEAKEAVTPSAKPMLGRDALTEKTNERLAATTAVTPSFQPSDMQQMHHDMKGMDHTDSG